MFKGGGDDCCGDSPGNKTGDDTVISNKYD